MFGKSLTVGYKEQTFMCVTVMDLFPFPQKLMLRESLQGIGNICVTNNAFEFHSGFSFRENLSFTASR